MISIQNLLQTEAPQSKEISSKKGQKQGLENSGEVSSDFSTLFNQVLSENSAQTNDENKTQNLNNGSTDLLNLLGSQDASKSNGVAIQNSPQLLTNESSKINPELLKTLNNGEASVNLELINQMTSDPSAEIKIPKIGIQVNKEVNLDESDLKNLQLVQEQLVAKNKSSSDIQNLLNQIKGTENNQNLEIDSELMINSEELNSPQMKSNNEKLDPMQLLLKDTKNLRGETDKAQNQDVNLLVGENSLTNSQNTITGEELSKKTEVLTDAELKIQQMMKNQAQKNQAQVSSKLYGKEQNLLANNLIQSPKNFMNTDEMNKSKFGKDELKISELKTNNELQSIKQDQLFNTISPIAQNKEQSPNEIAANKPQFDMTNIRSSNTDEIIKQVSDYITQAQVAGKDQLDLTVKHQELGQFKINVSKMQGQNQIDLQITTQSKEAHQFFVRHEAELMKNLSQSGIQISDMKVVASTMEISPGHQSESKQFYQGSQDQNQSSKQWASYESQQFGDGKERRKELWEEYRSRLSA